MSYLIFVTSIISNRLPVILDAMKDAGYSADNVAFGSGGALLQKLQKIFFINAKSLVLMLVHEKFSL